MKAIKKKPCPACGAKVTEAQMGSNGKCDTCNFVNADRIRVRVLQSTGFYLR